MHTRFVAYITPLRSSLNALFTRIAIDTKDDMPLDDKKYLQEHFEQNLLSGQEINNFICDRMPNYKNYLTIGKNPILNIYL